MMFLYLPGQNMPSESYGCTATYNNPYRTTR